MKNDRARFLATAAVGAVAFQFFAFAFFTIDISMDVLHIVRRPVSWTAHEVLEITSVLGLLMGIILIIWLVQALRGEINRQSTLIHAFTASFSNYIENQFKDWSLTESETAVAWGMVKGFSNSEIASMRGVTEGTVKQQVRGVLQKSGTENRGQFLSFFLDAAIASTAEES